MIPRMNYFTYLLERIKPVFDDYVPLESIENFSSMYFETNNRIPLKWDIRIGVQFDTIVGMGGEDRLKSSELPWKLEFHYKGCPDDFVKLNKSGAVIDVSYIKHSYINSLKESTATRTGSANEIIAQMKKNEEE